MVKEFIERKETSTNSDLNLVFDAFDHDSLGAELVDTFRFSHEHDLKLLPVGIVVDILGQLLIDDIVLDRYVDSYS